MAKIKIHFKGQQYKIDEQLLSEATSAIQERLEALAGGSVNPDEPELGVDPTTGEILDSWEVIINNVNNGTYTTKYAIGNYKPLDLGSEGVVNMQIAALDADVLSDGTGNAHITWIAKELLATKHAMNSTNTSKYGWDACEMRAYLSNDIYALIPEMVQNAIVSVDKTYYVYTTNSTKMCSDKLWIPSEREVCVTSPSENRGVIYSELFYDAVNIVKTLNGSSYNWWLRSGSNYSSREFGYVLSSGAISSADPSSSYGVALGFCM